MPFLSLRTAEFYPLTLTLPLEQVIFGAMTFQDRWCIAIQSQPELAKYWVEPTVVPDADLIEKILTLKSDQLLINDDLFIAVNPGDSLSAQMKNNERLIRNSNFETLQYKGNCEIVTSLQFIVEHNEEQIIRDSEMAEGMGTSERHPDFHNTYTSPDVDLSNITIDDRKGPVIIREGVTLLPGAKMMGPIVLLPHAVVKMGAELYPGTTIGSRVTVNGEVKNSIIHEYSAKGHAGYLGDSILGRWNNLGAGTTISNVAHTFSNVSIVDWHTNEKINYNSLKRGIVTGDFVKLGIMSKVYRGTAIGSFTSIATNGPLSGNIPPFTWWSEKSMDRYHPDRLRLHCDRQMALRDQSWNDNWENALITLLDNQKETENPGQ